VGEAVYFFYGTLMDEGLLAAVTGRCRRSIRFARAHVDGYRAVRRTGAAYPILIADVAARTQGRLLRGVTPKEVRRLRRFEGREYVENRLMVHVECQGEVPAWVFLPRPGGSPRHGIAWCFDKWRRRNSRRPRQQPEVEAIAGGNDAGRR